MKNVMRAICITSLCASSSVAFSESDFSEVIKSGTVNGNLRAYYNTRDYPERTDTAAFALGGKLFAETGAWGESGWGKLGVAYYAAHDLDFNSDDPAKVNGTLGDELEVLGEAYLKFMFGDSALSMGRVKINTPFANPSDAFMVPMTFMGYTYENKSFDKLTIHTSLLKEFKNRNSDTFVGVGEWTTNRLSSTPMSTDGVIVLGATYTPGALSVQGWYYGFSDIFNMLYAQANYQFSGDSIKPFVGVQLGTETEAGDEYLGKVDATLIGAMAGASFGKAKLTFAYTATSEQEDAFNNGAFLAPFNFSTSPIFTNSMLQTLENADAGSAMKLTFNYDFSEQVPFKISYATLDFENIVDREELNIDITYKFGGYWKGLSIRNRLAVVTADAESAEQTNNRLQLQYVY